MEVEMESAIPTVNTVNENAEACADDESQPIESDVAKKASETGPCGNCSTLKLKIRRYQQNIYKLKRKKQELNDQIQSESFLINGTREDRAPWGYITWVSTGQ